MDNANIGRYEFGSYEPVRPIPCLNLPELNEIECLKPIDYGDIYFFECEPVSNYRGPCPHCGNHDYYIHGNAADRRVHDISMGLISVQLEVHTPRYLCNSCQRSFSHPFDCLIPNSQFTHRLYQQIELRALQGAFTPIADEYGISTRKVADILIKYGRELEKTHHVVAPRVLGMDEVHIRDAMRGVFTNIEMGCVLEMVQDNKFNTMKAAIESMQDYQENIEIVTMDMTSGYVSVVEEILPHAKIIIDKFHVIANLYRKIETIRSRLLKHLKEQIECIEDVEEYKYKKNLLARFGANNKLFKMGNDKIKASRTRSSLLSELMDEFPEIYMLFVMKDGLERIYQGDSREEAEKRFEEWAAQVPKGDPLFHEMESLYNSMKRWKKYIFNYFDTEVKYSNAATEGLNSLIKHLNNEGRGYSFEILRFKVLFHRKATYRPRIEIKRKKVYDMNYANNGGGFNTSFVMHNHTPVNYHWEEYEVSLWDGSDIDTINFYLEKGHSFL